MPSITMKKNKTVVKTTKQSGNKMMKNNKKKIEANAGKTYDYDCGGFIKIDENPDVVGNCIRKNSTKIVNIWFSIDKKLTETVKLRYFRIKVQDGRGNGGYYIQHIAIIDEKNNRFIDVSNGRTRMLPLDEYMVCNNIIGYYDISFADVLSVYKNITEYCDSNILTEVLIKICNEYFMMNEKKYKKTNQPSIEYLVEKIKPYFKITVVKPDEYTCENNIRAIK